MVFQICNVEHTCAFCGRLHYRGSKMRYRARHGGRILNTECFIIVTCTEVRVFLSGDYEFQSSWRCANASRHVFASLSLKSIRVLSIMNYIKSLRRKGLFTCIYCCCRTNLATQKWTLQKLTDYITLREASSIQCVSRATMSHPPMSAMYILCENAKKLCPKYFHLILDISCFM